MTDITENFWQFTWRVTKSPLSYLSSSPLAQSAAAFGINVWCLILAVLAQFWVLLSALLLLAQLYNTWLVSKRRMSIFAALLWGLVLLFINCAALVTAVLGQFWVVVSVLLSLWQFWCLLQVCWSTFRRPT